MVSVMRPEPKHPLFDYIDPNSPKNLEPLFPRNLGKSEWLFWVLLGCGIITVGFLCIDNYVYTFGIIDNVMVGKLFGTLPYKIVLGVGLLSILRGVYLRFRQ